MKVLTKDDLEKQKAEIEGILNGLKNIIDIKAAKNQRFILIDGVSLPAIEPVLNGLIPSNYVLKDTFEAIMPMRQRSRIEIRQNNAVSMVTMYYFLLEKKEKPLVTNN